MKKVFMLLLLTIPISAFSAAVDGYWHSRQPRHDIYFAFRNNKFVYMTLIRYSNGPLALITSCYGGTYRLENNTIILNRKIIFMGNSGWLSFDGYAKRQNENPVMRDRIRITENSMEYWFNNSFRMVLNKKNLSEQERGKIFYVSSGNGLLEKYLYK